MSWLSSFLHPGKGYQAGQDQLDKYYDKAQGNLQPYNQNGQDQYATLQEYIKNLMDPTELNKKWIDSYSESPQAKQAEGLAQEHGLNAASSMGLMGSNTALDALQTGTTQIGLNDRQNYLNDMMQKYMQGAGLSQGIYGTGANTAGQMSQNDMNMGQNSGQMSFGKQNSSGDLFSKLLQGIVSFATPIGQSYGMNKLGLNNQNNPWSTSGGA